jgi:hypothetical protein
VKVRRASDIGRLASPALGTSSRSAFGRLAVTARGRLALLHLPGRLLGALESLRLHTSFRGGQTCLRNGFSECGNFKRF